ncbi:cytochrome c3 family protein [Seleniivibrio woodruffii]|uniref:Cytochrome c7-like protein n=1 Tax=Seleniivibrio woodruffii TaxID=1078050 RepID=A0A4R1K887_9BACT|nr:cytochrome c3 family protein [Seleniivibrio woodruffii]TCK60515.1 cytochrome c7-like protein [Seleniivibrio woodruffii]TVZ36143.1 cytochrome c7-like protein [Seleniivibrio woodruffii]
MKKVIIAMMVVFTFALVAYAAGPATIDLAKEWSTPTTKKAVMFPHDKHQAKLKCVDCHMTEKGGTLKNQKTGAAFEPAKLGIKGMKNPAHDEFCWECHTAKSVPQGKSCTKCHK